MTATLLISATHGYDTASRATMPFYVAKGAKEAGIDVKRYAQLMIEYDRVASY